MTIKVELFSVPGCSKCAEAKEALKTVAEDLGAGKVAWRDVDILEEMDYATDLGLMSSGGIAIDGKLVFPRLPSADRLRQELIRRLKG
jgi:thioredoxin 1